jgi:hypothetical protein
MGGSENPLGIVDRHQVTGWVFNKGLNLILHELDDCHMCDKFTAHYSGAKAHLHSLHDMVCSAWQHLIAKNVEKRIDGHQLQLKKLGKSILYLQKVLKRVCKEIKTAHSELEEYCMRLRKQLEKDQWDQGAANGSCTSVSSKSSKCPWPSQSPSLWPPKLLHHVSYHPWSQTLLPARSDTHLIFPFTFVTILGLGPPPFHHKHELHDGHGACIIPPCVFQLSCSFPSPHFLSLLELIFYSTVQWTLDYWYSS